MKTSRNKFLQLFAETSPNKLLPLPKKTINTLLNKKTILVYLSFKS